MWPPLSLTSGRAKVQRTRHAHMSSLPTAVAARGQGARIRLEAEDFVCLQSEYKLNIAYLYKCTYLTNVFQTNST